MKKQYRKPEIAIEDFVLNQFIAGSCTVKTNLRDTWLPLTGYPPIQFI